MVLFAAFRRRGVGYDGQVEGGCKVESGMDITLIIQLSSLDISILRLNSWMKFGIGTLVAR